MWIDRKTDLPVKIVFHDHSKNIGTVTFSKVETPKSGFTDDVFLLRRRRGYTYAEQPLRRAKPAAP